MQIDQRIPKNVLIELSGSAHAYRIEIGGDILAQCGAWAKRALVPEPEKIVVVTNRKIFGLYGAAVVNSLEAAGFKVFVCQIGDGERYKSWRTLEKTLGFFGAQKLKRTDSVVALGGGVVGDLAGFAAAIYLRGVRFLQIPTTLLAQIDSSVGGKTGVNSDFGKNTVGAFHQPAGVLIDVATLKTLPRRELTAGFCEAVKQGAIASRELFDQTADFLHRFPPGKFKNYFSESQFVADLTDLIAAQVAFKAEIVRNDEREDSSRNDNRSRKILNFGHTVAHALEKVTDYRRFKHGEAVGYGILAAGEIANKIGIFDKDELRLLNDVVRRAGVLPSAENIPVKQVIEAFAFDKKNIGDSLQWVLLEAIGRPKILQSEFVPLRAVSESIEKKIKKDFSP